MSQSPALPPLALTMGDPGGVGAEITLKAWQSLRQSGPVFFVLADEEVYAAIGAPVAAIAAPEDAAAVFGDALPVMQLEAPVNAQPGVTNPDNATGIIESIERAVRFALDREAAAVVTNPIHKSTLNAAGFRFPGHTEFLADLTKHAPMPANRRRGPVMMLAGPQLRTVPVTIHQSVKDAIQSLTPDLILKTAAVVHEALIDAFGVTAPRLAISGLNPHAGEGGMLGAEDEMIIAPAIDRMRDSGINARGPLSADTMFHEEARAGYDAAICMLHDQALIPAKTLGFHDAVNVTLGLPIIRTSPDHGTALAIAGKNAARADSLIAALRLAGDMAAHRRRS